MFQNYSQTFATQILALAGFVSLLGNQLGWNWAEADIIFVLGAIANFGGIAWALYNRGKNPDVSIFGVRKSPKE